MGLNVLCRDSSVKGHVAKSEIKTRRHGDEECLRVVGVLLETFVDSGLHGHRDFVPGCVWHAEVEDSPTREISRKLWIRMARVPIVVLRYVLRFLCGEPDTFR